MSTVRTELAHAGDAPSLDAVDRSAPHTEHAQPAPPLAMPTRAEWNAAGLSLLFHIVLMLVLAALLIPIRTLGTGTSIDGGLGTEEGGGELFDSIVTGAPEAGGTADLEKAVDSIEGVPAIQGALGSGTAGSGGGGGSFNAASALGSGLGGGMGKGVGFFGTRARADSVVFVVDMSGSMAGHRFDRAVEELIRSLNALEPSQKFYIFFYNGQTHALFDQRANKLLSATTATRSKAVKWIKALRPDGDTFPEDAIERALKLKPQIIFFLTDGEIPDTVRETARTWNKEKRTVIHTIAFEYEGGAEMLRGIAVDSRGKYRFVP